MFVSYLNCKTVNVFCEMLVINVSEKFGTFEIVNSALKTIFIRHHIQDVPVVREQRLTTGSWHENKTKTQHLLNYHRSAKTLIHYLLIYVSQILGYIPPNRDLIPL